MFRNAQDPVGVSARNVIRVANPALAALFGYEDPSELIGRTFLELIAPESRPLLLEMVARRARGEPVPGLYHVFAIRRDGTRFEVEVRTTTFVHDGEPYALALLRDLAEDERDAHQLYQAIFLQNSAVKLLIDPVDGQIVDANDAAAEFYGWPVEQLRQMRISEINTLSEQEVAVELDAARRASRTYFRFQHRIASGEVRNVDVFSGPVEVRGRRLLLSILHDRTERDAFEERLRQVQRLEAIGRLAGGVAHDFNNLLTIIAACGSLLQDSLTPDDPGNRHASELLDAVGRASELTRRLLAVGQKQELQPRRVDLAEAIRPIEGLMRRGLGAGVQLEVDIPEGLEARVDPGQLEQVVLNLVLNAGEATGGRGHVVVAAERVGDEVELRVEDDGRGMDAATRARVFEPFFSKRADGSGVGLGLASVYGIVTQSGGTVSVESAPDQGSTFRVRLPAGRPIHVLLVDDDDELRELLGECLTLTGFAVRALPSGVEALALTDEQLATVDVLVTDQSMPGPLGVEVATRLRERRPGLGVVLISGNLSPADRARLPAWCDFLQKPIKRAELAERIRSVAR